MPVTEMPSSWISRSDWNSWSILCRTWSLSVCLKVRPFLTKSFVSSLHESDAEFGLEPVRFTGVLCWSVSFCQHSGCILRTALSSQRSEFNESRIRPARRRLPHAIWQMVRMRWILALARQCLVDICTGVHENFSRKAPTLPPGPPMALPRLSTGQSLQANLCLTFYYGIQQTPFRIWSSDEMECKMLSIRFFRRTLQML